MKPICYDLFCGLGGWSEAFLAEGYECIGFDIEAHDYGSGGYPGELRIRDVLSIHGSELKDATIIVGSSPCQEFSYRAMPWKRAKALGPPVLGIELFNAQFRIQREASEAAGHYIPMIVENVRGAQKWVGPARWHYGSFYLWGDVPALMPMMLSAQKFNPDGTAHPAGSWFAVADSKNRGSGRKVSMNFHEHEKTGKPGRSFQSAAVADCGTKVSGGWFGSYADMKTSGTISPGRMHGKGSVKRKAASAMIAKIPYPLAQYIAKTFKPEGL